MQEVLLIELAFSQLQTKMGHFLLEMDAFVLWILEGFTT